MSNTKFDKTSAVTVNVKDIASYKFQVEGVNEPRIFQYFQTMNAGQYDLTAALFAENGIMYPPFEEAIIGTEAIANYLHKEARGIKVHPRQGIIGNTESGNCRFQITGKVETPLFGVNALWDFDLNEKKEIASTKIKLLASPKELLSIR